MGVVFTVFALLALLIALRCASCNPISAAIAQLIRCTQDLFILVYSVIGRSMVGYFKTATNLCYYAGTHWFLPIILCAISNVYHDDSESTEFILHISLPLSTRYALVDFVVDSTINSLLYLQGKLSSSRLSC